MKKLYFILPVFLFFSIYTLGQDTLIKRFPDGRVQEMRILNGGEIIKATAYHILRVRDTDTVGTMEYWIKYSWDKPKKLIESYWEVEHADTLEMLFFKQCPDYTFKQHYGNGPLDYTENYKNKVRDGDYEKYDEKGALIVKGKYSNWKKVGIWKFYDEKGNTERVIMTNGDSYDHGISINYTIIPSTISIFIVLILGLFISKRYGYKNFYLYFCRGVIIFCFIFPFLVRLIGQMAICALVVWLVTMFLLSMVNLVLSEKVTVKTKTSGLFAFAAFVIGAFYLVMFMLSALSNGVVGPLL